MKHFFTSLPGNIFGCFKGRMLWWHLLAILLTAGLVLSGCDWLYFLSTRNLVIDHSWWFPALPAGMLLPVILPLALVISGFIIHRPRMSFLGWAIGQAAFLGWLVSSTYKAITGRVHPDHSAAQDLSRTFRFGLFRGGIFWGWPSSHTTVAFAMAAAWLVLFPKPRWAAALVLAYAFYIGLSVSMTIHWFSDFVAGAIIGTVVGTVVGKSFNFVPKPSAL